MNYLKEVILIQFKKCYFNMLMSKSMTFDILLMFSSILVLKRQHISPMLKLITLNYYISAKFWIIFKLNFQNFVSNSETENLTSH